MKNIIRLPDTLGELFTLALLNYAQYEEDYIKGDILEEGHGWIEYKRGLWYFSFAGNVIIRNLKYKKTIQYQDMLEKQFGRENRAKLNTIDYLRKRYFRSAYMCLNLEPYFDSCPEDPVLSDRYSHTITQIQPKVLRKLNYCRENFIWDENDYQFEIDKMKKCADYLIKNKI